MFVLAEAFVGWKSNSTGLMSDVILTASVAIVVNGLTSWLLMRDNKENINIRAAYLHAATDTLVSAGIVISGIIIRFTGWYIIDPIISLGISVLILIPTIRLFCVTIKSPLK